MSGSRSIGARGEIRTRTVPLLRRMSLLLDYAGVEMKCSRSDSHRHWAGFKSAASALGYGSESGPGGRTCTRTGRGLSSLPLHWATPGKVSGAPGRNFACNLRVRSAALYTLSYGSVIEMGRPAGAAPARRSSQDRMLAVTSRPPFESDPATGAAPV